MPLNRRHDKHMPFANIFPAFNIMAIKKVLNQLVNRRNSNTKFSLNIG